MRELLEAERNKLTSELSNFAHRNTKVPGTDFNTDFPQMGESEDENASEVAQYTDNLSIESELEKALRDVESALASIAKGTYGICKYCEKEIGEARLRARPTSSSCIACKKSLTQEL